METRKINRSQNDRVIAGVCGGIAAYFQIDPLLVRIGFVLLTLFNGMGTLLYLVLWLLLPREGSLATDTRSQVQENVQEMQTMVEQLVERVRGTFTR